MQANFFSEPPRWKGALRHVCEWAASDLYPHEYSNPNHDEEKQADHGSRMAVYYIHGTCDRPGTFSHVAEALSRDLPENISKIHLVSFRDRGLGKGIESIALQLAHKIKREKDRHVILIGYSRGGIVASCFAEKIAAKIGVKVHLVIGICSPFGGSDLAVAPLTWLSDSIDDMKRDSALLMELQDRNVHSKIPYRYFCAVNDVLVTVDAVCMRGHEHLITRIEDQDHLSVLSSPVLQETIREFLKMISEKFFQEYRDELIFESDDILMRLEFAIQSLPLRSALREPAKNVLKHAEKNSSSEDTPREAAGWQLSVELAINVIENPEDDFAIRFLKLDARHHAPGCASGWKQFYGAMALLAGVAMLGLGIAGIPFTGGGSLAGQMVAGTLLAAGGAALFFQGRQKTLSKAVQTLALDAQTLNPGF